MTLAVLYHRLGPYHHARLRAASAKGSLVAVEFVASDKTYQWDLIAGSDSFRKVTLFPTDNDLRDSVRRMRKRLFDTLDDIRPRAVAIPGWSDPVALAALEWSLRRDIPRIVMSTSSGARGNAISETIKRRLLHLFGAAFVGGIKHRDYVARLGMPLDRIFTGYNAVDNAHFAEGAERARAAKAELRASHGLPDQYFLCCCRFIPEKNLPTLLEAYARYRSTAAGRPWALVLLGDGPLRADVEAIAHRLSLGRDIVLPGFRQYEELPLYYGLAGALVLPSVSETWGLAVNEALAAGLPVIVSTACGCSTDLVEDGRNGFIVSPSDVEGLARGLEKVAAPQTDRASMGARGREIVSRYGPESFADGIWASVTAAAEHGTGAAWIDRAAITALIARPFSS